MSRKRSRRGLEKLTSRQLRTFCILLVAANLLVAAILAAGILSHRVQQRRQQQDISARLGIHENMDDQQLEERYAIALGEASRQVYLYSEVTVQDDVVPLWISNGEDNSCAVSVTLELAESGKVLAKSRPIDPGWHLEELQLQEELAPGQYHCFARCAFYTMQEDILLGETVRQVLLTVQ